MVLQFICTNKGAHAETNLGTYFAEGVLGPAVFVRTSKTAGERWIDRRIHEPLVGKPASQTRDEPPQPLDADSPVGQYADVRMDVHCRRCGRHPQYSANTLKAMAEKASGRYDAPIDVSYLGDC
jgi:hypothetical protein